MTDDDVWRRFVCNMQQQFHWRFEQTLCYLGLAKIIHNKIIFDYTTTKTNDLYAIFTVLVVNIFTVLVVNQFLLPKQQHVTIDDPYHCS